VLAIPAILGSKVFLPMAVNSYKGLLVSVYYNNNVSYSAEGPNTPAGGLCGTSTYILNTGKTVPIEPGEKLYRRHAPIAPTSLAAVHQSIVNVPATDEGGGRAWRCYMRGAQALGGLVNVKQNRTGNRNRKQENKSSGN